MRVRIRNTHKTKGKHYAKRYQEFDPETRSLKPCNPPYLWKKGGHR